MKYHLKRVMKGKEGKFIKRIGHYDKNIGKSYTLVKLALKYNLPIGVSLKSMGDNLRYIERKDFKSNKLNIVHIIPESKGRRFDTLLLEEGFDINTCNKIILPMCKRAVGYNVY